VKPVIGMGGSIMHTLVNDSGEDSNSTPAPAAPTMNQESVEPSQPSSGGTGASDHQQQQAPQTEVRIL